MTLRQLITTFLRHTLFSEKVAEGRSHQIFSFSCFPVCPLKRKVTKGSQSAYHLPEIRHLSDEIHKGKDEITVLHYQPTRCSGQHLVLEIVANLATGAE